MEPAVGEIERQLLRKVAPARGGELRGGVGGHADFAGGAERRVAREGDHVGRGGIGQEIRVQPRERGLRQEDDRDLAAVRQRRSGGAEAREISVEDAQGPDDLPAVEVQARMERTDGDGPRRAQLSAFRISPSVFSAS
jgi:hypothetical protein